MCFRQVADTTLMEAVNRMNEFDTKNEQDVFLQGQILRKDVQRRRGRKEESGRREAMFVYHVMESGKLVVVCKKAFMSIYCVTESRVKRLCNLLLLGKSPNDQRGKHKPSTAKDANILADIHSHISSFPVHQTHYGDVDIQYLSGELTVKKMHEMFVAMYPGTNVSYHYYHKYFKSHFSLKFGRPSVDTCVICEEKIIKLKSCLNDNAKRVASAELLVHKNRSKKFYRALEHASQLCKERDDFVALSFDYMQNISLPKIPVQDMYYYRQLTVPVFSVHNLKTTEAAFYIYHEGQAKKGPNEVCSFLLDYMNNVIPNSITEIWLFCDGCPGQNKNNTVIRFLMALTAQQRFLKIRLFFPIRGHSFLPSDRDFAVVKRCLRRVDRFYTLKEVCELIVHSSAKGKFTVNIVESDIVYNFNSWWPTIYKKNVNSLESSTRNVTRDQKVPFSISSFMEFQFSANHFGIVVAKPFINGLVDHTFALGPTYPHNPSLPTVKAYSTGVCPIKAEKLQDLQKMLRYIPEEDDVRAFYHSIVDWGAVDQ